MILKNQLVMKLREWKTIVNEKVEKLSESIIDFTYDNVGLFIVYASIISSLFTNSLLESAIGGSIVYLVYIVKNYIQHRIRKERLESIDIERLGKTIDNKNVVLKKSISDILNDYIEDCFDRDVLFFAPVQRDDYIDHEVEKQMLNSLLDSAISNMSEDIRILISTYYGEDSFNKILGRKCMGIITIFVAQHNKNIYQKKDNTVKVEI